MKNENESICIYISRTDSNNIVQQNKIRNLRAKVGENGVRYHTQT